MGHQFLKSGLIISTIAVIIGCGSAGESQSDSEVPSELPVEIQVEIESPKSILSEELTNTIAYMGNEERLAYDVYNALYQQYGTKQFTNIATNGEYKHITAVQELVQKYKLSDDANFTNVDLPALGYQNTAIEDMTAGTYDIAAIQTLYDDLMEQGSRSEIDALKVGCIIEVVDINDLDHNIKFAEEEGATDIMAVFNFLREGSYSHYWAFDKGLKNKGEGEGCCPIALTLGHTDCPDYPQK